MATYWKRQHDQLTDLKPDHNHQHHLDVTQYTCLTQGQEATNCHYHLQRPGFIPIYCDGTTITCEGVKATYSYGFPCRGFGAVINPSAPIDIRPGTQPNIPHGSIYDGWNTVWARGNELLYGVVFRVKAWTSTTSFLAGLHHDPTTDMRYADYGVDLDVVSSSRAYAFIFGKDIHHLTRVVSVSDTGLGTEVTIEDPISAQVPSTYGHWVYLSPTVAGVKYLDSSYVASFWIERGYFNTRQARVLGQGLYSWWVELYTNVLDDWLDLDLTTFVPPTAVAFDLSVIAWRYTLALGVYSIYRDANSLIKSVALYRSSTRLPDGVNRSCGTIPDVCPVFDDTSSPRVYLWCTRNAVLRATKVREY